MTSPDQRQKVRQLVALTAPWLPSVPAIPSDHLGAVLADAALQAGVRYATVVRPRVDRIIDEFPQASLMAGLLDVLAGVSTREFLRWSDAAKPRRFDMLVASCEEAGVSSVDDLGIWLVEGSARDRLLNIHGVGPKTVDYLLLLSGRQSIPIDRHLMRYVSVAGVGHLSYSLAQELLWDACTHLGLPVTSFERGLWLTLSGEFPVGLPGPPAQSLNSVAATI